MSQITSRLSILTKYKYYFLYYAINYLLFYLLKIL